jgi:acyl carrier protein
METIEENVQDVFRGVFGDDQLVLSESTTAADVDGWDSLAHLNLIVAIEKRFGVKFATAEISRMKSEGSNVGTLHELLRRKLNRGSSAL